MRVVDSRGLPCPQPVIRAREALQQAGEPIVTVVDSEVSRDNVVLFARSQGCQVRVEEPEPGVYHVTITPPGSGPAPERKCALVGGGSTREGALVVLIGADRLGRGADELGGVLMRSFLFALSEAEIPPAAVIFINGGVRLTTEGTPVREEIQRLQERGTEVLSCGTCLDYFQLKDRLVLGRVTNMYEIVDRLAAAGRAISL